MTRRGKTRNQPRRAAYLLMTVLVCLAVVLTLATAWLRALALERQHVRADARGVQAEFLAASALSRAAARLAADATYAGETWHIDPETMGSPIGGTVTISVATLADRPGARRVKAVAEFPDEGVQRARRTRAGRIELSTKSSSEDESP